MDFNLMVIVFPEFLLPIMTLSIQKGTKVFFNFKWFHAVLQQIVYELYDALCWLSPKNK